jgi:hypothetical protein
VCSNAQKDGIISLLKQIIDCVFALWPNGRAQPDLRSHLLNAMDFALDHISGEPVGRDAYGHHAARDRQTLKDRGSVTTAQQLLGNG